MSAALHRPADGDSMNKISLARLNEMLSLEPEKGLLYWRSDRRNGSKAGDVAGSQDRGRYVRMEVDGVRLSAHRVVWALHTGEWPPDDIQIDHINGIKNDNRPVNLRLANNSQNQMNIPSFQKPKSGLKGVYFDRKTSKWRAMIMVSKKTKSLGYFTDKQDAHMAYCEAANKLHGIHANTSTRTK